jgi:hypothetical protein
VKLSRWVSLLALVMFVPGAVGAQDVAPSQPTRWPYYILWGAAGVSLTVGVIAGATALSAKADFDDKPTYGHAESVERRALIADVALGLGVVLAVSGTIFYLTRGEARTPQRAALRPARLQVGPLLGGHARGVAACLRF